MAHKSLTVAIISPEQDKREHIASAFEENPDLGALWTLADYPGPEQLTRIREARSGCVVFLDFSDAVRARRVASDLDLNYPTAATVAIQAGALPEDLIELMKLGIREVVTLPVSAREANDVLQRASRKLGREPEAEAPSGDIHAFLPAKPGSGATTVAVHTAAAAARLSGQQTLLIDFDLRLGMTSFLLKLSSHHSVLDALALSDRLEPTVWDQLVSHRDGLDVLGSAPIEFDRHISDVGPMAVLEFARRRYRYTCVDLPGEMRQQELETLHRAKEIFLVCTSEVGTLHMAQRKADILQSLDIQGRVTVILNRIQPRGAMASRDIEQVLRMPVQFTLPAAEADIVEATQKAIALEGKSPIAQQFEIIARRIIGEAEPPATKPKPRRLIEFFSVTPARDRVR